LADVQTETLSGVVLPSVHEGVFKLSKSSKRQMAEYAPHIIKHVNDLRGREVLIIGDIGLDEYVLGQVRRISPEAPVPVVEVDSQETRLGLAANVAQNIASLGGVPRLIAVVGRDAAADQLRNLLKQSGVSPEHLVVDSLRPTTRKLRVMVQNHHIVRVDYEHKQFVSSEVEDAILAQVKSLVSKVCAVIIQDYAKGVISERLVSEIVKLAKAHGKKVLADPNRTTPLATYRGVDVMTPNYDEAAALTGIPDDDLRKDVEVVDRRGNKLMEVVGAKQMVVTLGKDGMRIFENGAIVEFPTNAKQVFDVTGAGDTVIAALALSWGSGFTLEQSCALANFAAGVVVGKIGCVPCSVEELKAAVEAGSVA
jgi:rfaE bifunctional protein kinase chain/domain